MKRLYRPSTLLGELSKARLNLVTITAGIFGLLFLGAVLWPVSTCVGASPQTLCLSNLNQIGRACQLYATDFDDLLPGKEWNDALYPYVKAQAAFDEPLFETQHGRFGYAFHRRDVRKKLATIADPDHEVLFFESFIRKANAVANLFAVAYPPRHKGKNNFAFVDGHTRALSPAQLADLAK